MEHFLKFDDRQDGKLEVSLCQIDYNLLFLTFRIRRRKEEKLKEQEQKMKEKQEKLKDDEQRNSSADTSIGYGLNCTSHLTFFIHPNIHKE